jgi:hypothetical protein
MRILAIVLETGERLELTLLVPEGPIVLPAQVARSTRDPRRQGARLRRHLDPAGR